VAHPGLTGKDPAVADKRKFNSKMNAKGLENHITEEQARHMATHQGNHYLLIVSAHAGSKVVDEDGSETIHLIPDLVELVPADQEDRVRAFQRALYMERPDQVGQRVLTGISDVEMTVDAAGAALEAAVEHDEAGEVSGLWDGNPDTPPSPVDADEPPAQACDYPGCTDVAEHDGEHTIEEQDEAPGNQNVVAFSGKG